MRNSIIFAVFLTVMVAVIGLGYAVLPSFVGWWIHAALAERGFPDASLKVARLNFTAIELVDIDLGPETGVRVQKIEVSYSPARLADGVVDGVTLVAPQMPVGVTAQGVDLKALTRFQDDQTAGGAEVRVQGPIRVENAGIEIQTPFGDVSASVSGEAILAGRIGTEATFDFALVHPDADVRGRFNGVMGADGSGRADVEIESATSRARVAFSSLIGAFSVSHDPALGPAGFGELTLRDAAFDQLAVGDVDLAATLDGLAASARLLLGGDSTGVTLEVAARTQNVVQADAPLIVVGSIATDGLRGALAQALELDALGSLDFNVKGRRGDVQALVDSVLKGSLQAPDAVTGWVEASQFSVRAPAGEARIDGLATVRIGPVGWQVQTSGDVIFDVDVSEQDRSRNIRGALRSIGDQPVFSGNPNVFAPLRISFEVESQVDGEFPVSGTVGGNLWSDDGQLRLENIAVRLTPIGTRIDGLEFVVDRAAVFANGPLDDLDLEVSADARLTGGIGGDFHVGGGRLSVQSALDVSETVITLRPAGCIEFRADALRFQTEELRPGPIRLCPLTTGEPLLALNRVAGEIKNVSLATAMQETEFRFSGTTAPVMSGSVPRLDTHLGLDLSRGTWWARLVASGGSLTLDEQNLQIDPIAGRIEVEGAGQLLGLRADVASVRVSDRQSPRRFPPIGLNGRFEYSDEVLLWEGTGKLTESMAAQIAVRHRLQDARGRLSVSVPEWVFSDAGPQLSELFPQVTGVVGGVDGRLSADARIDWAPRGVSSSGRLMLTDVSMMLPNVDLEGISGDIRFSDLINLRSDGPQSMTLRRVDAGIPLFGGEVRFDLPGDGQAVIESASWPLAGGRLSIRDASFSIEEPLDFLAASLDGLDGSILADLLDIEGFDADGSLSGQIPVRLTDKGPMIENARLRSDREGSLRFQSPTASDALRGQGESAELLAQALEDFHYTDLEVTVDGPLDGELSATATIKGSNPALYDGQRIDLNVRMTGALRELLQSASVISDIPDAVGGRLQGPAGNPR